MSVRMTNRPMLMSISKAKAKQRKQELLPTTSLGVMEHPVPCGARFSVGNGLVRHCRIDLSFKTFVLHTDSHVLNTDE